jgi:hypothetical protein
MSEAIQVLETIDGRVLVVCPDDFCVTTETGVESGAELICPSRDRATELANAILLVTGAQDGRD